MKRALLILSIIAALSVITVFIPVYSQPLNTAIVKIVEKRLDSHIAYRSLVVYPWRGLVANGLELLSSNSLGLSADHATLSYDIASVATGRLHMKLGLKNVRLYRASLSGARVPKQLYLNLFGDRVFDELGADIFMGQGRTLTSDIRLVSDKLKISGDAFTDTDRNISCFLCLLLSDDAISGIPDELKGSLMRKEEGPWSSTCIGIMGNYRTRALRIFTDRFRMSISQQAI